MEPLRLAASAVPTIPSSAAQLASKRPARPAGTKSSIGQSKGPQLAGPKLPLPTMRPQPLALQSRLLGGARSRHCIDWGRLTTAAAGGAFSAESPGTGCSVRGRSRHRVDQVGLLGRRLGRWQVHNRGAGAGNSEGRAFFEIRSETASFVAHFLRRERLPQGGVGQQRWKRRHHRGCDSPSPVAATGGSAGCWTLRRRGGRIGHRALADSWRGARVGLDLDRRSRRLLRRGLFGLCLQCRLQRLGLGLRHCLGGSGRLWRRSRAGRRWRGLRISRGDRRHTRLGWRFGWRFRRLGDSAFVRIAVPGVSRRIRQVRRRGR